MYAVQVDNVVFDKTKTKKEANGLRLLLQEFFPGAIVKAVRK